MSMVQSPLHLTVACYIMFNIAPEFLSCFNSNDAVFNTTDNSLKRKLIDNPQVEQHQQVDIPSISNLDNLPDPPKIK